MSQNIPTIVSVNIVLFDYKEEWPLDKNKILDSSLFEYDVDKNLLYANYKAVCGHQATGMIDLWVSDHSRYYLFIRSENSGRVRKFAFTGSYSGNPDDFDHVDLENKDDTLVVRIRK